MRVSRAALLIIPCGRSLDRAWSDASESAADEHAAQKSSQVALNLASALVRIARMIPKGQRQIMPAAVSAFLVGSENSPGVKVRVKRLVELCRRRSSSTGQQCFNCSLRSLVCPHFDCRGQRHNRKSSASACRSPSLRRTRSRRPELVLPRIHTDKTRITRSVFICVNPRQNFLYGDW